LLLLILGPVSPRGRRSAAAGASPAAGAGEEPLPWRRGLAIAAVTAVWANVHPAALIAPGIVVLHALAARWGVRTERAASGASAPARGRRIPAAERREPAPLPSRCDRG
jgi:hypothetical protein